MKTFFLLCALPFLLTNAIAAQHQKIPVCNDILRGNNVSAILATLNGEKKLQSIEIGAINIHDVHREEDFVYSQKYRLIISKKGIAPQEICNLATCLKIIKLRSICPDTSEFSVQIGVIPLKLGPGKFIIRDVFSVDEIAYQINKVLFRFENVATGTISTPWFAISNLGVASKDFAELFRGTRDSIAVQILNLGNLPTKFKNLESDKELSAKTQSVVLNETSCINNEIMPNASCTLRFKAIRASKPEEPIYSWTAKTEGGSFLTIEVERNNGNPLINLRNSF